MSICCVIVFPCNNLINLWNCTTGVGSTVTTAQNWHCSSSKYQTPYQTTTTGIQAITGDYFQIASTYIKVSLRFITSSYIYFTCLSTEEDSLSLDYNKFLWSQEWMLRFQLKLPKSLDTTPDLNHYKSGADFNCWFPQNIPLRFMEIIRSYPCILYSANL